MGVGNTMQKICQALNECCLYTALSHEIVNWVAYGLKKEIFAPRIETRKQYGMPWKVNLQIWENIPLTKTELMSYVCEAMYSRNQDLLSVIKSYCIYELTSSWSYMYFEVCPQLGSPYCKGRIRKLKTKIICQQNVEVVHFQKENL